MSIISGVAKSKSTGYDIEQSLRFNDDDSAYLSWTPESAGDRKTWTFSTWVKRNNINTDQWIFSSNNGVLTPLSFTASNNLALSINSSDDFITSAVYRDTSSWYHIVLAVDTTQATASDRSKLYVNGEQVTDFSYTNYASQNEDTSTNDSCLHTIGRRDNGSNYVDMYLAETHFIDGQALTPEYFGEFDETYGHWKPKKYEGTYGTNGFYLPYKQDYAVEGFSTTLYTGNGSSQYVGGVGFEPDLVWIKARNHTPSHALFDTVRGADNVLRTNGTDAENASSISTATYGGLTSFETDGFVVDDGTDTTYDATNGSNDTYVAWSWDMGDSTVENTDGSITSQVRANPTYGQSIVSYAGNSATATVGHGLSSAPEMIIVKNRDAFENWAVYCAALGNDKRILLDTTGAATTSGVWGNTTPSSTVFNLVNNNGTNQSGADLIAYCFHSVAGYSKIGSYTGNGSSGNAVTTGFKPAWVMIKRTDSTGDWAIFDSVRGVMDSNDEILYANLSNAEDNSYPLITFTDTGFELDTTGNFANASGGTYIYMAFADTREYGFWLDDSGNNNDFTINNLTESDVSLDSPTNNFCTLNPLTPASSMVISEGNTQCYVTGGSSGWITVPNSTIPIPTSGKWYNEVYLKSSPYMYQLWCGYATPTNTTASSVFATYDGQIWFNGSYIQSGLAQMQVGDIIGFAIDADSETVQFMRNGTNYGNSFSYSALTDYQKSNLVTFYAHGTQTYYTTYVGNWGQDSSFAGNKASQGYTDANGYGDFYYEPPAGYLALCTANMEEPSVVPSEHMDVVTYTGNGSTQSISTDIKPEFTWIKCRSNASQNMLYDAIRGATKTLKSNQTDAEATYTNTLTSFDTNGISLGNHGDVNTSGWSYVSWNWKAGGTGVSNTDGTITSQVSANVDAGFSIVSYTGNGATATVGHSLASAPEMIIVKNRNEGTAPWMVYDHITTATNWMELNTTNATASNSGPWNNTEPTSSVFTVNTWDSTNKSGSNFIAYCFHSVEGYSKIGTYTGNGSTDGTFVYTGFRPKYVMIKRTDSASDWAIIDTERDNTNIISPALFADLNYAENASADYIDSVSNGFKLRYDGAYNQSGGTYLFIAFAEMPFSVGGGIAR